MAQVLTEDDVQGRIRIQQVVSNLIHPLPVAEHHDVRIRFDVRIDGDDHTEAPPDIHDHVHGVVATDASHSCDRVVVAIGEETYDLLLQIHRL